MVEQRFIVLLGGFNFKGFIDRVDLIPGTKDEVEIIDYKTGKYEPGPVERSRQLLLYARGIEHIYPEFAKNISFDYEHGFEKTKDEKACEQCGYRLYCGD